MVNSLTTAQCICAEVHNEQATAIYDHEVKTAVNFKHTAVEVLKEPAC
jgi:hypothetical protein